MTAQEAARTNNGVRASLIPLLTSNFEDREMRVKWDGVISQPRKLPGGGAMGASLGNWEFLSQTNDNADCEPLDDRFKFVDDLTTLEIINLINIGISSFRMQNQVPSDIPTHGQYVEGRKLKSQKYLDQINTWTKDHKMVISAKKTNLTLLRISSFLHA